MTPKDYLVLGVAGLCIVGYSMAERRTEAAEARALAFDARATKAEAITLQYRRYATVDSTLSAHYARIGQMREDSLRALRAAAVVTRVGLDSTRAKLPLPVESCKPYMRLADGFSHLADTLSQLLVLADSIHAADSLALDRQRAVSRWQQMALDSVSTALASRPAVKRKGFWAFLPPPPVVVVGYGATMTGGVVRAGPSVSVGWRIGF